MPLETQPKNSLAHTTEAIQYYDDFVSTLERILGQRQSGNPSATYYIYDSEDIASVNYAGVDITLKASDPGSYANEIRNAFKAISEMFGISFAEVSDPTQSLFDVGRLEDKSSRIEYYTAPDVPTPLEVAGQSSAYANNSEQLWRLMTFRESDIEGASKKFNQLDTISTIWHELGHTVGLTHPADYGYNPDFNQLDTVMSYNITQPPNPYYTDADRAALMSISAKLSLTPAGLAPVQIDKSSIYVYDEESQRIIRNIKSFAAEADSITGTKGSPEGDVFMPESTDDLIKAGGGDDLIKAGGGIDLIKAGNGDDIINGGNGIDKIFTGKGSDTVKIKNMVNSSGFDSIVDFSDDDTIRLIGFQPNALRLEHYGRNTLLMYHEDVIAAVGHDINFADHVKVVR